MLIEKLALLHERWGSPQMEAPPHERTLQHTLPLHKFIQSVHETGENRKEFYLLSRQSRRKIIKLAYLLLADAGPPWSAEDSFRKAGFFAPSSRVPKHEALMWLEGTSALLEGLHPWLVLLMMSAWMGLEQAEASYSWLKELAAAQHTELAEFIVPSEMADMLTDALENPRLIETSLRIAGMPLAASAIAGMPLYHIERILQLMGPIGSALLRELIQSAREKLTSEEIAAALQAFMEIVTARSEMLTAEESEETSSEEQPLTDEATDAELIRTMSELVMELDAKILRSTLATMQNTEVASMLRCLEALAHERVLSIMPPGRQKRVLEALEELGTAGSIRLVRDAQFFAQKLLAAYAPRPLKPGETLDIPASVRAHISAILSRE